MDSLIYALGNDPLALVEFTALTLTSCYLLKLLATGHSYGEYICSYGADSSMVGVGAFISEPKRSLMSQRR